MHCESFDIGVSEVAGGEVIQEVNAWFMLYDTLLCNNTTAWKNQLVEKV